MAHPRGLARAVSLAVGLALPAAAGAADVCVVDNLGGTFVFQELKTLKPNRAVPLYGIYVDTAADPDETFPFQGVAVLRASGNVEVGVHVHNMSRTTFAGPSFSVSMQTDATMQGTGGLDADGNNLAENTSYAWAAADCKALVIP
jgi:hypothetical protein